MADVHIDKRDPAIYAVLLLIYTAWGALSIEKARAATADELPAITAERLEVRHPATPALRMRDPFHEFDSLLRVTRLDVREWIAETTQDAWEGLVGFSEDPPLWALPLARAWHPGLEGLLTMTSMPKAEELGDPLAPIFELTLESVTSLGGGQGVARISGRTVGVGESIRGFDPVQPPVLLRVGGVQVEIFHRSRLYVLDLDVRPSVWLGPRPEGVAPSRIAVPSQLPSGPELGIQFETDQPDHIEEPPSVPDSAALPADGEGTGAGP